MDPTDQFIEIAPDSPTDKSIIPLGKGGKKSIAVIEYELLSAKPYGYTLEELKFATHVQHKQIPADELEEHRKQIWDECFARPYACMRASPLTRKYGWGAHCDKDGKIAIFPAESKEYRRFITDKTIRKFSAMRSKREAK